MIFWTRLADFRFSYISPLEKLFKEKNSEKWERKKRILEEKKKRKKNNLGVLGGNSKKRWKDKGKCVRKGAEVDGVRSGRRH